MGRSAIELNIAVLPFRAKTPPIALCEGRDHPQIEQGALACWALKDGNERRWNSAADLPDVSKCFGGIAQRGDHRLLRMGLFSIF
jgi:hypothetical protein